MVRLRTASTVALVGCSLLAIQASAQHLPQAALDQISESAAAICGDFDRGGFQRSAEANVAAEAELEGLIGRLLNLGVEGAGQIQSERYANVLQDQLGEELKNNRACRLKIWNDLIIGISVAPESQTGGPEQVPSDAPGESSVAEEGQYVLPGGVMSGSVVRGPLLYCVAYNSESAPIVVYETQFGYVVLYSENSEVYLTSSVPCERMCELAPGTGGTFDGPPNDPRIQEATCSVRYDLK
jgi:hypothetical protein